MEVSSQEDPTSWISVPFPLGAESSGTAPAGTSALPPSLPRAGSAFPSHPSAPRDAVPRSRPSGAPSCCFPGTRGVGTRDKDTQHTRAAAGSALQGAQLLFALEFGVEDPINVVRQDLGEALWHPATSHCNSSIRLDILNSRLGVVKPFPRFSSFFVSLCSGHRNSFRYLGMVVAYCEQN